jgi:glycosyltransferase involved in cell wall biosynthesis
MISVVIPVYNENEILRLLHSRLAAVMESVGEPWEVVYINDGSSDGSLASLLDCQAADPHVTVVELSRNWGHQPALTAGLANARGSAVVLMDADLQDPPEVIPSLIAAWRKGGEVVVAQRRSRAERGIRGGLFRMFYTVLGYLSDFPIPLNSGIFGLLDRRAVDAINSLSETNRYLPGLRAWVGFHVEIVFYQRAARAAGEPKQTFWRLLKYGLDAIFSFSYKPLRLSLVLGFATSLLAIFAGLVLTVCRVFNIGLFGQPVVVGYTSTILSILLLGGVQLFCVGLLGEYTGRIYDEVKRRPLYIVHRVHNPDSSKCMVSAPPVTDAIS